MGKPVLPYANKKGADQPAHPHSLISTFVVHCLDSTIPILAKSKISRLYLASEAEQAGLSLPRRQVFSRRGSILRIQTGMSKQMQYRPKGAV